MKIEMNRENAGFVSHNGLTLFCNRVMLKPGNKEVFVLRVTKREGGVDDPKWTVAGEMELTREEFEDWVTLQIELKEKFYY